MIYRLLKKYLPTPLPEVMMAVWYTALLMLALLCAAMPNAPFLYLGL